MTQTDELRRLLDDIGTFWVDASADGRLRTCWKVGDSELYNYFDEDEYGVTSLTISSCIPPMQALMASLVVAEIGGWEEWTS